MNYPFIHSLSTVGLLKHYHQDYLINELRTDFVGNNGIGKSIIADLLQLIFIADRDLIKFGTEGIKEEVRKIESLPYKTPVGYAFLNIQINQEKYVTIGTAITNKPIPNQLFLILNNTKWDDDLDVLSFNYNKLPRFKHFLLEDDIIPSPEELAIHLREKYGLYIRFFENRNTRKEYYKWLFDKEVLSINLSIDEHLKAFAKVIQSFSKAKTLNLSKTNSIKDFLFDSFEADNSKNYNDLLKELSSLLTQYRSTSNFKNDLELKQKALKELRNYKFSLDEAQFHFHKAQLIAAEYKFQKASSECESSKNKLNEFASYCDLIKNKIQKLENLNTSVKTEYGIVDRELDYLYEYKSGYDKVQILTNDINNIIDLDIPNIQDKIKKTNFGVEESINKIKDIDLQIPIKAEKQKEIENLIIPIKGNISFINDVSLIYERYNNGINLRNIFNEQQKKVKNKVKELEYQLVNWQNILNAFETEEDNILQWVKQNHKQLDAPQEALLFRYLDVLIDKPTIIRDGIRFTHDVASVFQKELYEINNTKNGFWFKNGLISEYIKLNQDEPIFNNVEDTEVKISIFKNSLKSKIENNNSSLQALESITKVDFNVHPVILDLELDVELLSFSFTQISEILYKESIIKDNESINRQLENLQTQLNLFVGEQAILQKEKQGLETTITLKKEEIESLNENLNKLKSSLKVKEAEKLGVDSSLLRIKSNFRSSVNNYKIEEQISLFIKDKEELGVKKDDLNNQLFDSQREYSELRIIHLKAKQEFDENETVLKIFRSAFEEWEAKYKAIYQEEVSYSNEPVLQLEEINAFRKDFETKEDKFRVSYQQVALNPKFNPDENNIEILEQIQNKTFNLAILERVLLGSIGSLDNISGPIEEANSNRNKFGKSIFAKMLSLFSRTLEQYHKYEDIIRGLNNFFKGRKISNEYYFQIFFKPHDVFKIDWIEQLEFESENFHPIDSLFFKEGHDINQFILEFFNKAYNSKVKEMGELLDPKRYFDLSVKLTDENNIEIPGSTGETYASILLLGVARLSKVQTKQRKGIRFIILEEVASLDSENFDTFPNLAEEFGYQLITMTPRPYGSNSSHGWYLHCLIKGEDKNINYPIPASFFKTNEQSQNLSEYINSFK